MTKTTSSSRLSQAELEHFRAALSRKREQLLSARTASEGNRRGQNEPEPESGDLAEQAIRAVPADERSASLALGSTKWQTIVHVVLPIAIPGLVTGVILTAGRIFGEAAALLFTAGLSTQFSPLA